MAPAAYHWARASSAILVRLVYYILGQGCTVEALLYVDDFLYLAVGRLGVEYLGMIILILASLGA
eukprot:5960883-Lingulodinium_polyedra.AAC.1